MTCEEFNDKYQIYIEDRFEGCDISNEKAIEYLDNEFKQLVKIPNFKFSQIKSKFDWFCFYCDNVPREKVEQIEENLKKFYGNPNN